MIPIIFSWFLTFGFVPEMIDTVHGASSEISNDQIATMAKIGVSAELKKLNLYSSVQTYQYIDSHGTGFLPYRADYCIGLSYTVSMVTFSVLHECDHPVLSYTNSRVEYPYISSKTFISVTIKGTTR